MNSEQETERAPQRDRGQLSPGPRWFNILTLIALTLITIALLYLLEGGG